MRDLTVKGMSDERQSWPIASANKNGQKICRLSCKIDFIVQLEHALFSTRKSPNFSWNAELWYRIHAVIRWPVNLKQMHDQQIIYCRVTNGKPTRSAFYVVLQSISQATSKRDSSSAIFLSSLSWRDKWRVSWFNDFIGRFSQATKPRPQKLANFIDRLTQSQPAPSITVVQRLCISRYLAEEKVIIFTLSICLSAKLLE